MVFDRIALQVTSSSPSPLHFSTFIDFNSLFRCHGWWVQDQVPYHLNRFRERIYRGFQLCESECAICFAKMKPYQDRVPCNGVYHLQQCSDSTCNNEPKYGKTKRYFCRGCFYVKNFQCGFCRQNFFTGQEAEQHMYVDHMYSEPVAHLKCDLCDLKVKFFTEREKIPFLSTSKFISMELNMRQLEEEFTRTQLETETKEDKSETKNIDLSDLTEFPSLKKCN